MKKININVTLLLTVVLLFFSVDILKIKLIFIVAAGLLCYQLMKQIAENTVINKDHIISQMEEIYINQKKKLIESLNEMIGQMVEEEKRKNGELQKLLSELIEQIGKETEETKQNLQEFYRQNRQQTDYCIKVIEHLTEKENLVVEKTEKMANLLEKEGEYCSSVEEQVKTIKVINEITAKKLQTLTENHYDKMSDLFDDQNDNISEALKNMEKIQLKLLSEHYDQMEKKIDELKQTMLSGTQPVLDQNRELLQYIQKVQKDWTELDKEELNFLNKVWGEQ